MAFNYGLQGKKLHDYHAKYPQLQRLPIFNHEQVGNKYDHVKMAQKAGIMVPITCREPAEYPIAERADGFRWIKKPYYSLGGRDIDFHDENYALPHSHYVQQFIDNRRYEMRVHAWAWIDPSNWIFQKRVHEDGENQLAWNHHNGGKFITIDNPTDPLHNRLREAVKKLMKKFGYQFGAADFIIQNPGKKGQKLVNYFIEWNLAPGWTLARIEKMYKDCFEVLQTLTKEHVDLLMEGIFPWEPAFDRPVDEFVDEPARFVAVQQEEQAVPVQRFLFDEEPEDGVEDIPGHDEVEEMMQNRWFTEAMIQLQLDKENLFVDGIAKIVQEHANYLEEHDRQRKDLLKRAENLRLEREEAEEERAYDELLAIPNDDDARYAEAMNEAQAEMNFCPECGHPVNRDIFGGLPKFCTSCGRKVRD
ncbi:MAG: hypothetical protein ACXABY_06070 [Candidatus Thorarchaeota archaeon]